jgi:hypothetical protein
MVFVLVRNCRLVSIRISFVITPYIFHCGLNVQPGYGRVDDVKLNYFFSLQNLN